MMACGVKVIKATDDTSVAFIDMRIIISYIYSSLCTHITRMC